MSHALTSALQIPCLVALLPHLDSSQIDVNFAGAPGVQASARPTRRRGGGPAEGCLAQ